MVLAFPEIADLAIIAGALFALLLIVNMRMLSRALSWLFAQVPVVGGWISQNLIDHATDALNAMAGWLTAAVGGLVGFLWTPVHWVIELVMAINDALTAVDGAITRVIRDTLPAVFSRAVAYAEQRIGAVIGYVDTKVGAAIGYVDGRIHAVLGYVDGRVSAALAYVDARIGAVIGYVDGRVNAAIGYVDSRVNAAIGYVDSRVDGAVGYLRSLVTGEVARLDAELASAAAWTQAEIGVVEQEAGVLYRDAVDYAQRAAAAAEVAGVAAAGVVAVDLEQYLARCGRNLCGGLNEFSTLLQQLLPLVEGGLLVALLAEAARDPRAVADEATSVLGPIVIGAAGVITDVVGVAA